MITPSFSLTATERVLPKLALDFTTASLDPRVTFTRTTDATHPATYTNSSGVITAATNNQPRFDYDPITLACKGLLIEESRTNSREYSQNFSTASWLTLDLTNVANQTTAPDGTNTGNLLTISSTNAQHYLQKNGGDSYTSGTAYTQSIYAKANTTNYFQSSFSGSIFGFNAWCTVDLSNGSIVASGASGTYKVTAVGNGWYRIAITATATSTGAGASFYGFTNGTYGRLPTFTGNGTDSVYIWGAQLEAGAFATSYIPTTTTALTRNADVATMTGTNFSDWYNGAAGTILVQAAQPSLFAASKSTLSLINTSISQRISMYRQSAGTANGILSYNGSGVQQIITGQSVSASGWKQAIAYSGTTVNYASNAVMSGTTATNGFDPATINELRFGNNINGGNEYLNGWIVRVEYWPQRLTNAEMQAFTKV